MRRLRSRADPCCGRVGESLYRGVPPVRKDKGGATMRVVAGAVCGGALALLLDLAGVSRAENPPEPPPPPAIVDVPPTEVVGEPPAVTEPVPPEWTLPDAGILDGPGPPPPQAPGDEVIYYTGGQGPGSPAVETPEPSSLVLAGVGLSVLGWYARKRRRPA